MHIENLIWLDEIIEKLERKHRVFLDEVKEVFNHDPHFRFIAKGRRHKDENLYAAYGRTEVGRYLTVFFIY